ncbi:MAG: pilus assembly protein TadG-related protein [Candidatus Omnitrophota bacterium]|nr:pilus assembly protein TadG-related protein [Candidatus Omnitrophota bacterium]
MRGTAVLRLRYRSGQVTPFMIAVIVVLIMAMMVAVNLGKVGLTKTNTGNAADAGALAGATIHNNTLNALVDINSQMAESYVETQVAMLVIPWYLCAYPTMMYVLWLSFIAAEAMLYASAIKTLEDGYEMAENQAYKSAFSNANITEGKARNWGETYAQYLQRKSPLQTCLEDEDCDAGSLSPYSWQAADGRTNTLTIDVDAPDVPMIPMIPGLLVPVYWYWVVAAPPPACVISVGVCLACAVVCFANMCTLTGVCACGNWVTAFSYLPCPVVAMADLDFNSEYAPEITVKVTRDQPSKDLGIWNMRYTDPNTGGGIRSVSRAITDGGSVGSFSDTYESQLISTDAQGLN